MLDEKLKLEDLLEKTYITSDGYQINSVVIIGAGIMGQGIAQTIASAGMDVLIVEKDKGRLKKSKDSLSESIDREIKRWAMTSSEKKSIMSRISWEINLDKINDYDLIIEAVDEDYELKRSIFKKLDQVARKDIIFVSNTSTLSLTKIAEVTERQEKIIGVHFLHPVPKIPVVEIIKCLNTSNKTVEIVKSFAARIGKTPVEVYEYPGFVTTRAIVPLLNEAMYILLEDVATAKDIDTAMKLGYNFQYGPLEMADMMGLMRYLHGWKLFGKLLVNRDIALVLFFGSLLGKRNLGEKPAKDFISTMKTEKLFPTNSTFFI
jgi:3-hydroxybutyryl-CoA dehydrogenase